MKRAISNLITIFYPNCCIVCGQSLVEAEEIICLPCEMDLPKTGYQDYENNPLERMFWGRASVEKVTSLLFYGKGGKVQKMIHELKYKNNYQMGQLLGKLFAFQLLKSKRFHNFDLILPLPLHPKKEKRRGYNQCKHIALGMNQIMNIDISENNLCRRVFNPTQTKKSRYQRWENVDSIFEVRYPKDLEGKTVLLIDDVITTGSTIEACASALSKVRGLKLWVGTIACPQQ